MFKTTGAPLNVETLSPAGNTQATATVVLSKWSPAVIRVIGNFTGGIVLPGATKGKMFFITNIGPVGGLGTLNVYPAVGQIINALATNAAYVMAGQSSVILVAVNTTRWDTFPRVAG